MGRVFASLTAEGEILTPIDKAFRGDRIGVIGDRFGVR
jgi:uncharacterized glyoxalase superfamily protein PhnB